jgi:hypothetical protein
MFFLALHFVSSGVLISCCVSVFGIVILPIEDLVLSNLAEACFSLVDVIRNAIIVHVGSLSRNRRSKGTGLLSVKQH